MKRALFIALTFLSAAMGCQREKSPETAEGEPVDVSFRVYVPGETKAIGDGGEALRLTLRVYDANHNFLQAFTADRAANESGWTLKASVVPGIEYDFCFWACSPESKAYGFDGQYVTVDYSKITPNSNRDDAFWGTQSVKVTGAFTQDVTLRRPLGLLALYMKDDCPELGQADLNDAGKFVSFDTPIVFADGNLKAALIAKGVDTDQDGEISYYEASVVNSLEEMLGNSVSDADFTSFDEFQYFLGITTLPAGSFNNWTKLTSITLPDNLEKIAVNFKDYADAAPSEQTVFRNCPVLASIKGKFSSADGKALIYKQKGASTSKLVKVVEDIGSVEEITLPEGIDTIARYAFYGSRYKTVNLPKSLKVIGESAFEYSMIETLDLPLAGNGNPDKDTCRVTTVYDNTFAHCFSLKRITGARNNGRLRVCAEDRLLYRDTTAYAYALGCSDEKVIIPGILSQVL